MAEQSVTIFGATGYTGRLCARAALDGGLRVRLAGRRQDALAALAAGLGGAVEIAVADAREPATLRALADSTDVLVTTAGPYAAAGRGRAVLEAALAAGTHYLDVAAEPAFLDWAYDQGGRAAAAGTVICPGFGVVGAAGELLAALAAEEVAGAVRDVRIGYLARRMLPTAGSIRSVLDVAEHGGVALAGGRLVSEPPLADDWTLPFPPPLGPQPGLSFPAADVVAVGRSLGATGARAYAAVPDLPGLAGSARRSGRALAALARSPARSLALRVADRLPAGPAAAGRAAARLAVVVEVSGARGSARAWCRFRDVYATTARIVVASCHRLLKGGIEPGARTPSQVAGEAGGFLAEVGARWERLPPV
jgi:short subunit dehydrogenase-like uncharacterized protein